VCLRNGKAVQMTSFGAVLRERVRIVLTGKVGAKGTLLGTSLLSDPY
jgi:hypothetical protein